MTRPHTLLHIEVTTWDLERILESLEGKKDTPTKDERRALAADIKKMLAHAEPPGWGSDRRCPEC